MPEPGSGTRTMLSGNARQIQQGYGGSFYGAGDPLPAVVEGQPIRQWDFPPGVNMTQTPRHTEPFNFRHLRAFSNVELVRMAIETRKDQLERLDWMVKPREEKLARKAERDPRCLEVEKFFAKPDGQTPFQPFFRALEEDLLAIDAPCLERVRTRGGKLIGLEYVDGATINLLVDNTGRRPRGDDAIAYQQVIRGLVWANLPNRDIIYAPRNVRTGHIYGFAAVEQIIVTINTIIRRQASQLAYFTDGNVPQGIITAPEGWTTDQIRDIQEWFDQRISGNQAQQRSVVWTPHDAEYQAFKDSPIKDDFDEWLARIVSNAFALPPTPFIRQMNKGTAGEDQSRALEEGLEPLKLWRKRLIDGIIADDLGYPDLEFVFKVERELDPKIQSEVENLALRNGSAVIDEVRDARGLEPLPDGLGAIARIYVADGALTLEQADKAGELKANPPEPPAPVIAAPNGAPPKKVPAGAEKKKVTKFSADQPRDENGRWSGSGSDSDLALSKDALLPTMEQFSSSPDVHENIIGMTVDGKAIFNPDASLGIPREAMPQIPDDQRAEFIANYESTLVTVDPNTLGPTQNELDSFKVGLAATGKINPSDPPLVSSDHYIIDGHHHWAGAVVRSQVDSSTRITIRQLGETRVTLMRDALAYDTAHGIEGEGIADKLLQLARKYSDSQPRDDHGRFAGGGGDDAASAQSMGLVDAHGVVTEEGLETFASNWIAGNWESYQHAAESVVKGQSKEAFEREHGGDPAAAITHDFAAGVMDKINESEALDYPLYRGLVGVDYKVGDTFSESLTTWTSKEELAKDFAHDAYGTAGTLWEGQQPGAVFKVTGSDMHGINITDINPNAEFENDFVNAAAEHITSGQYRVTSVEGADDLRVYSVERIGNAQASDLKKVVPVDFEKYDPNQPRDERGRWAGADEDGTPALPGEQLSPARLKELFGILAGAHPFHVLPGDEQSLAEWDETLDHAEWEKPGDFRPDQSVTAVAKYSDDQPRDENGRWSGGGGNDEADVLFEVGPNPDNAELSERWNSLSVSDKQAITDKVSAEFTPQVLNAAGIEGTVEPALGGFEGEINPSLVLSSDHPFEAAGTLGETFGQKAMVIMDDEPMKGLSPVGMVSIEAPGADAAALGDMQGKIGDLADGFTYRDGHMEVLNFSGQSDEQFATEIDNRLGHSYEVEHATVYSAYIEAKDYARPESDSHGNPWEQTASSLRSAFSQRLEENLQQIGDPTRPISPHTGKLAKVTPPKILTEAQRFLSVDNPLVAKIEAALSGKLLTAFNRAKKIISDRIDAALSQGDDAQQNLAAALHLIDVIDLSEIFSVHELLLEGLEEAVIGAGPRALASVGVEDASQLVDQISESAVAYARERAAELVRLEGDESLIETTRQELRDVIADGMENNVGKDQIVEDIRDAVSFSEYRADLIAKTEIAFANSAGKQLAWDQLEQDGQTLMKQWFASGETGVCDECQANEDDGEIPYGDDFESGEGFEPAHPACRCVVTVRVVAGDGSEASGEQQDTGEEE